MAVNQKSCREPSVPRCLSCEREYCDVICGVPMHRTEIIAEINVGVLSPRALKTHDRRQGKLRKRTKRSRSDAEAKNEVSK